jgi:hypothetical protein
MTTITRILILCGYLGSTYAWGGFFHLSTGYINCTSVHIISVKHLTDYAINSTANVDTPLINGRDQFYIVKKQSEFTKKLSETNITKLLEILIYA